MARYVVLAEPCFHCWPSVSVEEPDIKWASEDIGVAQQSPSDLLKVYRPILPIARKCIKLMNIAHFLNAGLDLNIKVRSRCAPISIR